MSHLRSFGLAIAVTLLLADISQAQFRVYNNIDPSIYSGFVYSNGGDGTIGANHITRLTADDIHFNPAFAGNSVTAIYFTVTNLNPVAVTARPRLRFYTDNANSPGNIMVGFSFAPITFAASSVNIFFFNPAPGSVVLPAGGNM